MVQNTGHICAKYQIINLLTAFISNTKKSSLDYQDYIINIMLSCIFKRKASLLACFEIAY